MKRLSSFKLLANPATVNIIIMAFSACALAAALLAQYGFGLQPCPLCIYQRWPYVMTALLGLIGLACAIRNAKLSALFILISSIVFFGESMLAFYHVGVEQHWWRSFIEGCRVSFADASPDDLLGIINATAAVPCDQVPWADPVFNISMAGYNMIFAFLMGLYSLVASAMTAQVKIENA